jgi:hypothetical protein
MPKLMPDTPSPAAETAVAEYRRAKAAADRANGALWSALRRAAIALRDDGLSLAGIGGALGVTKTRAAQIMTSIGERTEA